MTAIKKAMDNKIISGIVIAVFGSLMAWGVYVTWGAIRSHNNVDLSSEVKNLSQKQEIVEKVTQKVIENVCSDVEELKKDTKEIRNELKDQRGIIYSNQEKILETLGSIHRSVKLQGKEMNFDKVSKEGPIE